MYFITFDIETYHPEQKDEIDVGKLRVSVVGAYLSWLDQYVAFLEEDVTDFLKLIPHVDLLVGYNQLWFDLPVLQKYATFNLKNLPNYDILVELEKKLGYKVKLNDLCKVNLEETKTDSFEQFKHYYWRKQWLPLIDYCMHDVRLTNQLFQLIVSTGKLKYPDMHEIKEVNLDQPQFSQAKNQPPMEIMDTIF